jgi:hypothetical protein
VRNPLRSNRKLKEYIKSHPFCEACGGPARGLPHHIKHKDSGGSDEPENLLRLCHWCHYGIVHSSPGIRGLIEQYPHLRKKVLRAKPVLAVIIAKGG